MIGDVFLLLAIFLSGGLVGHILTTMVYHLKSDGAFIVRPVGDDQIGITIDLKEPEKILSKKTLHFYLDRKD